ncbi:unnamed protein product [Leptidea sinapis]|uniref:Ion transport domain-containing protein n=1 Tax=Leptidea sinapis TaxID=189913 RepID=A0A5E4PV41_9NEOP|nr:unnamed protein product [Leptidea sinapis]
MKDYNFMPDSANICQELLALNFNARDLVELHNTWYVPAMCRRPVYHEQMQDITGMRILVMLLLDTLPMLGNVLLLCFFVFFIFGIVGVQLWEGILRQRCELMLPPNVLRPNISFYYEFSKELDYICTTPEDSGMHLCGNFPPYRYGALVCNETAKQFSYNTPTNTSCVNWNQYYTNCTQRGSNPFQGTISFDNIGLAWVAIFLVISLEGWTDIMYYVQDAHSFWDWIYFVLLIVIGSFFMINLCLVVIATQFSETKKREMERMRAERARFTSSSTLASSTNNSEPATCYAEIVKYVAHLWRRFKRRMAKKIRVYRYQKAQLRWRASRETLQLPANRPKQHHPRCPKNQPQGNGKTAADDGTEEPISRPSLLRVPSLSAADLENASNLSLLSPPSLVRRRSSVMFSDTVLLHTPNATHNSHPNNICSSEKMTQTEFDLPTGDLAEDRAAAGGTMSCQELLALSGALSAALPTGQVALDSFFEELTKGISKRTGDERLDTKIVEMEDFSCCADLIAMDMATKETKKSRFAITVHLLWNRISKFMSLLRKYIKIVANHKYFQQGILLAILINTLSMGIEYHNQPEELTVIVEISNVVFSAIFAVEMVFKIISEGPFRYISNGFNVFDGIIVILSAFELSQSYGNEQDLAGSSGLSVLRTFRLLRILKLVRFMPNLRRQLFVMLRTMDNVAVFFSLLVLTQEDWNVVLFNGMEKTSHWAALYFVALMTFGNYVLFNLLVAILVEGFSSERNERREREQRELAKSKLSNECFSDNNDQYDESNSISHSSDSFSQNEIKNYWKSADDVRKAKGETSSNKEKAMKSRRKPRTNHNSSLCKDCAQSNKCNLQKESKMLASNTNDNSSSTVVPMITHTAATPQDSPSTTLEPGASFRDFNVALSLERSSMLSSLDSIDRTSCSSIPGLLKPPNSYTLTLHSAAATLGAEKARLPMSLAPPPLTLALPSTRSSTPVATTPRSLPSPVLPEKNLQVTIAKDDNCLNVTDRSSLLSSQNLRKNDILLSSSIVIKNDTQSEFPNNRTRNLPTQRVLTSPARRVSAHATPLLPDDLFRFMEPTGCLKEKEDYSLYIFPPNNLIRRFCTWMVTRGWFDNIVLLFIALNCITLAMERPNIPPDSKERAFLSTANYVFTVVFAVEMFIKVVASGMFYGPEAYFTSGWNIMDGSLVIISIIDLLMSLVSESSPRIFGILRVFRLLRSLRPLRVINRAPGLKLVVQTLLSSLRPIGNIVLICCTFFIIFGILGVQLFKGAFFYCEGANIKNVKNRTDCLSIEGNVWVNRKYNFDDLGKALMSLFVLSSRDGWVNIMYTGLDAVGVDQQPIVNYSEWRLLYFIAFILLVGFFVLNMFVGVVVENFHRCREEQEKEERVRRAAKRALQMEKKRRKMHQRPYYADYSQTRLFVHNVVTSKYFDLAIAGVIGLNVVTMAIEYYRMPPALQYALKIFNYFFTAVFILEAAMKLVALGFKIYLKDKWNQLDVMIVILSIVGIVLEELETNIIPINPTIMRVMRVLRIARVLKLLKMAKGIRALLDTVMQALPQVGNLGLLFFLLFFIFAALGVELFGRLECSDEIPCQGLGEHAHFANFGMAFLTLFRVATGDNWNGIMKDTLREDCDSSVDCVRNCCVSTVIAPIFFVVFVLMAQFVLVNVVVAVLMKHLEESHKQMEDEIDMDVELERELEREADDEEDRALCKALEQCVSPPCPLNKVSSLPANFTYSEPKQQPIIPSPRRRKTLHSHHALLPAAPPQRRASLSPHAFGRRRQDTIVDTPALYEEDARFIDADDIEDLEPGSPPTFTNRRQRVDKINSLRSEETRLLRPAPVLLTVPTTRQSLKDKTKRKLSTESAISKDSQASLRSQLSQQQPEEPTEEEKIRIVIAERRMIDTVKPEPEEAVELAECGS